jgi:antitoxin (DNA-binding transcriptional repressor) of toxin-antitoxin stability system
MAVRTVKSDEARTLLRDLLDDVTAGREVVIERYNKPVGVLIPHTQWQRWKKAQREEIARIRAEMDAGHDYSFEEVEAKLKADGLLP